jgi:hypothetical protein
VKWINVKNPWGDLKLVAIIFSPFVIIMILGLLLSWNEIYWVGSQVHSRSDWIILFYFGLIPGSFGIFIILGFYFQTIVSISISETQLGIRYPFKRTKKYKWKQIEDLVIGYRKATYLHIKIGFKESIAFEIDEYNLNRIMNLFQRETGRKVLTADEDRERRKKG